jgi:hypothetical protein
MSSTLAWLLRTARPLRRTSSRIAFAAISSAISSANRRTVAPCLGSWCAAAMCRFRPAGSISDTRHQSASRGVTASASRRSDSSTSSVAASDSVSSASMASWSWAASVCRRASSASSRAMRRRSSDEQAAARSSSTASSLAVHSRGRVSMAQSDPRVRPSASVSGTPA